MLIDKTMKARWAAACLLMSTIAPAQAGDLVLSLKWGDSSDAVAAALDQTCEKVTKIAVEPPQFPLARESERHILCQGLEFAGGEIEKTAFVLADNKLVLIELRDGALEALIDPRPNEAMHYLNYEVYEQGEIFVDKNKDIVWLLSSQALHPNLFTWKNPLLDPAQPTMPRYNASAELPAFISLGADIETLRPQMQAACPLISEEKIERVWLATEPQQQTQINCFGFEYAGFPRKFEAVFGDGKLALIWILTGAGEEDRVRRSLTEAFGPAEQITPSWEVFAGGEIALRKDKPEVLIIAPELVPHYQAQFSDE